LKREIAFTTFLKLLQLPDGPRRASLKKLASGSGYPYWRPLQKIASEAVLPGANIDILRQKVEQFCTGHQQKHNKNGLTVLHNWAQERSCEVADTFPEIVADFGSSGLAVRLRPDVSFRLNGTIFSMALWATTKPELSKEVLSIGLFFMKRAYEAKGYTGHQFLIFDTVKDRVFSEIDILASTLHLLKSKHDVLRNDWAEVKGPSPGSPDGPARHHAAAPTTK
jgi:hypothetical protein